MVLFSGWSEYKRKYSRMYYKCILAGRVNVNFSMYMYVRMQVIKDLVEHNVLDFVQKFWIH